MILLDPDLGPHPALPAEGTPPTASRTKNATERIPSTRALGSFLRAAQGAVRLRGQVTVLLTTDSAIRRLNRQFRGKNKATDVLSFPVGEAMAGTVAGDLAISVPTAARQAKEQGHRLTQEIKILMLHGLLHLAGYDHETDTGQMARRERLLRGRLKLPQGLIERAAAPVKARKQAESPADAAAPRRKRASRAASISMRGASGAKRSHP